MNGSGLKIALLGFVAVMSAAPSVAHAACAVPAPVNAVQLQQFNGNPDALLTRHASGGAAMVTEVRNLVSSDASTLPLIMALVPGATPDQRSAIGTGLGQASAMCLNSRTGDDSSHSARDRRCGQRRRVAGLPGRHR